MTATIISNVFFCNVPHFHSKSPSPSILRSTADCDSMYSDGLCVYTELGWLDDPHQFLTDISSLGASQTTDLGQCVNSAETAMRASYEGCGYTGEDWTRLDALISVSSYVQCTSQMFSQQCEERVRESWHSWLEQSSSSSSSSSSFSSIAPLTTTGSTCEANVREMLQKISL